MNLLSTLAETTVTAPTVDTTSLVDSIKTLLGGVFTVENLVTIIGGALALTVGLVIFWFGFRFIKGKVLAALKKGKM